MGCPFCGWTITTPVHNGEFLQNSCCRCGARGPKACDQAHADQEWERRATKSKVEAAAEMERSKRLPTKEPAIKIAKLFHRQLTTPWSSPEIAAYKQIGVQAMKDLDLVLEFYTTSKYSYLRTSLLVFCRNFQGEADKARAWVAAGKPIPYTNGTSRQTSVLNPRVAGSANEGRASGYAGIGAARPRTQD